MVMSTLGPSLYVLTVIRQSTCEKTKEKIMNDKALNYVREPCGILTPDWLIKKVYLE